VSAALEIKGVWKGYPDWQRPDTLRGQLAARLRGGHGPGKRWALADVSARLEAGGSLGILGGNGAGKSTLLRLAAGLARPTRGQVATSGNVAAVLSLGDAFDGDLSGRENALTTAMIAGLSEAQARACLDDAIGFAELEEFQHSPVRTYSEGMKLRLAFGVVTQVPCDLLLLDEVLTVGDMSFQAKCLEWVRERRAAGAGLLFASHDLVRLGTECDQAIWLEDGRVVGHGPADEVVSDYRRAMMDRTLGRTPADARELPAGKRVGSQAVTLDDVVVRGPGDGAAVIAPGEPLTVSCSVTAHESVGDCVIALSLDRIEDGVKCLDSNTAVDGVEVRPTREGLPVALQWERVNVQPGRYVVTIGAYESNWEFAYDLHMDAHHVEVTGAPEAHGVLTTERHWRVGD
jgi:lipopolysaccharide transport system ATP-binding protein